MSGVLKFKDCVVYAVIFMTADGSRIWAALAKPSEEFPAHAAHMGGLRFNSLLSEGLRVI